MKINSVVVNNKFQNCYINQCKYNSSAKIYFSSNNLREDSFSCKKFGDEEKNKILNLGKIIGEPTILNINKNQMEKCLLIYANNQNTGSYKLIKNNPKTIFQLSDFLKKEKNIFDNYQNNSFSFTMNDLNYLKENYSEIFEIINALIIAEINYVILNDQKVLNKLYLLGYQKIDREKEIIGIQNFITYQKEYKNAYRFVAIPLLKKILDENPNIIIKASAFGENPSSPVNLYLRYGFIPLSENLEEVKKHTIKTSKGKRIDPKYQVVMYLPQDAILYKLIKDKTI